MDAANIAIPATKQEFYTGLGTAITSANQECVCPALSQLVLIARAFKPEAVENACGKLWCLSNANAMQALGSVAQRALDETCSLTSLSSDIYSNLWGSHSFMRTCHPTYLFEVFMAGAFQEDDNSRAAFLRILVQIAEDIKNLKERT